MGFLPVGRHLLPVSTGKMNTEDWGSDLALLGLLWLEDMVDQC